VKPEQRVNTRGVSAAVDLEGVKPECRVAVRGVTVAVITK
jgi:hypothetical protein